MGSTGIARRKIHVDADSSQTDREPAADGQVRVEYAGSSRDSGRDSGRGSGRGSAGLAFTAIRIRYSATAGRAGSCAARAGQFGHVRDYGVCQLVIVQNRPTSSGAPDEVVAEACQGVPVHRPSGALESAY